MFEVTREWRFVIVTSIVLWVSFGLFIVLTDGPWLPGLLIGLGVGSLAILNDVLAARRRAKRKRMSGE